MSSATAPETEVKIAVASPAEAHVLVASHGFHVHVPRVFEANVLYDFGDLRLRQQGKLLRLREAGDVATLTFKGKSANQHHKVREEIETRIGNTAAVARVLQELDLGPVFRYEKYRTEYTGDPPDGVITVDETPIGVYLEIEGPAAWIDATAAQLGFGTSAYILESYGALYLRYCRERGIAPSNMVFSSAG